MEIDPLGIGRGVSYYAYGLNNPLIKIDYQGLCETKIEGSLLESDWCVSNVEMLFGTARRKDVLSPLFVDLKGDLSIDLMYGCVSTKVCCGAPPEVKTWNTYLYFDYTGIVVPYQVPKFAIPSPTRLIAILRAALLMGKLEEFAEQAEALLDAADIGGDQACKLGTGGPVRLGGSC